MRKKILIIEPHSDDAMFAAGGYLLKLKQAGDVDFFFALINASDMKLKHGDVSRQERIDEYQKYVDYFGGTMLRPQVDTHQLPLDYDARLDMFPISTLIKFVEQIIDQVRPDVLMAMAPSFHQDHRLVYEAVIAATRPTFYYSPSEILLMENPTYIHELYPNMYTINNYVRLDEALVQKKIELIREFFPSQINEDRRGFLSLDSIKKWAQYRGFEAKSEYAEAFALYSRIIF